MSVARETQTTIRIPTPLRKFTDGQATVAVQGETVGAALDDLARQYPALKTHLFSDEGTLRSFVNVYLNDEDIRYLDRTETRVGERDELAIVPSVAGGHR